MGNYLSVETPPTRPMQPTQQTQSTIKVGKYFNYSCSISNPYSIDDMEYIKVKHPGIPHKSPGLWKQMPYDILELIGFQNRTKLPGLPFYRFTNTYEFQTHVYVKVSPLKLYEYDAFEVVDFQEEDWKQIFK